MLVLALHWWLRLGFHLSERGDKMSEHLKVLGTAREQMVKARRGIAEVLSKPYDSRTTPGARTTFTEIQNTIEQIDKAIADERKLDPHG
jgi:hypothetical protein